MLNEHPVRGAFARYMDDRLRLYAHDLVRIPLPIPGSLAEQAKRAGHLLAIDDMLASADVSLANFQQQKRGLMHDLLTGRVRVDVPEPAIA